MLIILALLAGLALLAPRFGADSRDGLDWAPGHFWRSRPTARPARAARPAPSARDRQAVALMARRLVQLYAGLALYGLGIALQVASGLGNDPWDVFHQGLSRQFGLSIGAWIIIVGALVMALWIPLRQRPGLGTVSNVVLVGLFADLFLYLLPEPEALGLRWAFLIGAILVGGFATGCYIGAGFGPGPRDGLMTGLAARGHSIRVVRTGIEVTVLALGWLLGGTVGIGTLLYAVTIGPLAHVFIPVLRVNRPEVRVPRHGRRALSPTGQRAPDGCG